MIQLYNSATIHPKLSHAISRELPRFGYTWDLTVTWRYQTHTGRVTTSGTRIWMFSSDINISTMRPKRLKHGPKVSPPQSAEVPGSQVKYEVDTDSVSETQETEGLEGQVAEEENGHSDFEFIEGPETKHRKQKRKFITFSVETENELGEWFRENELFYNKGLKVFKDTQKKERLYEEKAAALNPPRTPQQLKTWINGMRTRYGRLTEPKSGKGTDETKLSERDKWIVETFSFLSRHIVRVPSRQTAKFRRVVAHTSSASTSRERSTPPPGTKVVESSDDESTDASQGSTAGSCKGKSKGKNSEAMQTPEEDEWHASALARLLSRADQAAHLQTRLEEMMRPRNPLQEAVQQWVGYQSTQLVNLHPSLWEQYSIASMNLLLEFMAESRKLKQQERVQVQQQTSPAPAVAPSPATPETPPQRPSLQVRRDPLGEQLPSAPCHYIRPPQPGSTFQHQSKHFQQRAQPIQTTVLKSGPGEGDLREIVVVLDSS